MGRSRARQSGHTCAKPFEGMLQMKIVPPLPVTRNGLNRAASSFDQIPFAGEDRRDYVTDWNAQFAQLYLIGSES
jgi:hypothetical protein